jgi:hypothetical protein
MNQRAPFPGLIDEDSSWNVSTFKSIMLAGSLTAVLSLQTKGACKVPCYTGTASLYFTLFSSFSRVFVW